MKRAMRRWTSPEIRWLRENYHRASPAEIRERFPGVPRRTIGARAHSLGLKRRGIYKGAKRQPVRRCQNLMLRRAHLHFQAREQRLGF